MDIKKLLKSVHATQSKKKIIIFKDKKNPQTLRFNNSKEFDVIEVVVDSGLIASGQQCKCDFFLYVSDPNYSECREHYIELKGTDLEHAIEQISETIKFLENNYSSTSKNKRKGYIICNRCPMTDTQTQRFHLKMRKQFGLELKIQSRKYDATI